MMNDDNDDWVRKTRRSAEKAAALTRRAWLHLPGARFADRQLQRIESELLTVLRERLERVSPAPEHEDHEPAAGARTSQVSADSIATTALDVLFGRLVERSQEEPEETQRAALFRITLRQLVPDHVRILGALSDGSVYPLIHIVARAPLVGRDSQLVACNISNVGRASGVMALALVPHYVAQLRQLGLVEEGVEVPGLLDKYEILETDDIVLRAFREVEQARGLKAHVQRRTLRISPLGYDFWLACHNRQPGVIEPPADGK